MTRRHARHAYAHSSIRRHPFIDLFCLTPAGIRAVYPSPKLLAPLPARARRRLQGRVIWISTSNPRYAVNGIRQGATLAAARKRLAHGKLLHVGGNDWYLAPAGAATAVLEVRHGLVQQVGIADKRLTGSPSAERRLLSSF
jgi:hypothetical protein